MREEKAEKAGEQDPGEPDEAAPAGSSWAGLLKDAAKQLLPILLTAGSLIGFVAFAGAVIVWTRFDAIGVPPEQAVKAVPQNELVATGSSLLLLFGFFGLLAVLATFLVDRGGRATPGMSRALLLLVAVEGIIAVMLAEGAPALTKVAIVLGFLVLVGLAIVATFHTRFATYDDVLPVRDGETEKPRRGPDSLHDYTGKLRLPIWMPVLLLLLLAALAAMAAVLVFEQPEVLWRLGVWFLVARFALALVVLFGAARAGLKASWSKEEERKALEEEAWEENRARDETRPTRRLARLYERLERHRSSKSGAKASTGAAPSPGGDAKRMSKRRPHRLVLKFWGVCLLVALAVAAIAGPAAILGQWWLAASFGTAFVLAVGVWRVAVLSKPSFTWYGLVVFLSVPLFGTCTLMARNVNHPLVQPMAMIRSTDGPGESIQGIYVTEASDRVYFANVATEGCENSVRPDSGRLLWVPKSEVVAMSIGPLQDVDEAGRSALEMADALTPDVETPTGEHVSLAVAEKPGGGEGKTVPAQAGKPAENQAAAPAAPEKTPGDAEKPEGEKGSEGADEEAEATAEVHRLQSAGPAVRPYFGAGLKLVPADAEPGDVVELRMSAPNGAVDGFGPSPAGYNLRLNGVRLAVLRVPATDSDRAEYVKTVGGRVLPLEWYFDDEAAQDGFVRLKSDSAIKVNDRDPRDGLSLRLRGPGMLAPLSGHEKAGDEVPPSVTLPNGETEELRYGLLRRAWSPTRIKFRVPENATTGVVSVECGQLGGQPVLTVVQPPVARVAVRMQPGSESVTFDSSHSVGEAEGALSRHWTIAGRHMGEEPQVSTVLPPRLSPYLASLTITDSSGLSDTVELRLLRLPSSRFAFGSDRPARKKNVRRVREALRAATDGEKPVAIELDGHADAVGSNRDNLSLSMQRAERLRSLLFTSVEDAEGDAEAKASEGTAPEASASEDPRLVNGSAPVPMIVRAFGESCPIVQAPGPQAVNRRVEVFLLGPGATVATGKGCHSNRVKRTSW